MTHAALFAEDSGLDLRGTFPLVLHPVSKAPTSEIDTFAQLTMDCMESALPALSRPRRAGEACF
jgi:hypothetical protein